MGGIGPVIVGGLYTRWGNATGAFAALITGSSIGVAGIVLDQIWRNLYDKRFFLHGQWIYFISLMVSCVVYTVVSLLVKRQNFNLEKMLHRGKYAVASDHANIKAAAMKPRWHWSRLISVTEDFTRGDKWIYGIITVKTFVLLGCFIVVSILAIVFNLTDQGWSNYHRYWMTFNIFTSFVIAVWLTTGGFRDMRRLFRDLKTARPDYSDDGTVIDDTDQPEDS